MDINIWSPSVLVAIIGIALAIWGASSKISSKRKTLLTFGLISASAGIIVLLMGASLPTQLSFLNAPLWGGLGKTTTIGGTNIIYSAVPSGQGGQGGVAGITTFQPTASYSTIDKFSSISVTGTSYYKVNNDKATTTAYTNTNKGDKITYWVSNVTTYVLPATETAHDGVTPIQADAYLNGSLTISGYDIVNDKAITQGAYNTSMAANANAKIKLTVIGSAKTANMPFGGIMVVEFNNTIPTASCSGDGIVGLDNKYQLTYTPSRTNTRYIVYEVANGFDVSKDGGNTGVTNIIRCDFTNGASNSAGFWFVNFIPANYYLTNDGRIVLDIEKAANSDTARTGFGGASSGGVLGGTPSSFVFGAS